MVKNNIEDLVKQIENNNAINKDFNRVYMQGSIIKLQILSNVILGYLAILATIRWAINGN